MAHVNEDEDGLKKTIDGHMTWAVFPSLYRTFRIMTIETKDMNYLGQQRIQNRADRRYTQPEK